VDCSKIYINMCEKAREIQKLLQYDAGNFFYCPEDEECIVFPPTMYSWTNKDYLWLPRQDQLQGKLGDNIIAWCSLFFEWIVESLEPIGIYASDEFDSMEQLWLAFVMLELYNKKWDGTKWTK